jgi:hypothetical protein
MDQKLYRKRVRTNRIGLTLSMMTTKKKKRAFFNEDILHLLQKK